MTKKQTPIEIDLNDPKIRAAADQAMNEAANRTDAFLGAIKAGHLEALGLPSDIAREFEERADEMRAMRTKFK